MSEPRHQQQPRSGAARDAALWSVAATAADLALLVGLSLALQHRHAIRARAAALLGRARRRRRVDEQAVSEWAREVSALSHGEPL